MIAELPVAANLNCDIESVIPRVLVARLFRQYFARLQLLAGFRVIFTLLTAGFRYTLIHQNLTMMP